MKRPRRIQLSRRKGFNLQAYSKALNGLPAINIARPNPLGNPFVVGHHGTRSECLRAYEFLIGGFICVSGRTSVTDQRQHLDALRANLDALRGNNVACWCNPKDGCHGDLLLKAVNKRPRAVVRANLELARSGR